MRILINLSLCPVMGEQYIILIEDGVLVDKLILGYITLPPTARRTPTPRFYLDYDTT